MKKKIIKLLNDNCKNCRNLREVKQTIFDTIDFKFSNIGIGTNGKDETILQFHIDGIAFDVKAIKTEQFNFKLYRA